MIQYKNKGRCKLCEDVIESKHRHDFVTCSCGSFSLDGGNAYQRVLWRSGNPDDIFEILKEPLTITDVQKTAVVSAQERELEQEYYQKLLEALTIEEETHGEDNGIRPQDDICEREVPVRAPIEYGKEVGKKVKKRGASTPP
jgi:hypothetical protein